MAKKDSLAALVRDAAAPPTPPPAPHRATPKVSRSSTSQLVNSTSTQVDESPGSAPVSGGGVGPARYETFHPKQARLTVEQLDELRRLARRLNQESDATERITENTLIRVAINGLLEHASGLRGSTEAELDAAFRQHLRR